MTSLTAMSERRPDFIRAGCQIGRAVLIGTFAFCWLANAQGNQSAQKEAAPTTAASAGRETFRSNCASCHGIDGTGGGPAAAVLKKRPTDLTQLSNKNGGKFPRVIVSSVIRGDDLITDHGTRDMPIWGDAFRNLNHDESAHRLGIPESVAGIPRTETRRNLLALALTLFLDYRTRLT